MATRDLYTLRWLRGGLRSLVQYARATMNEFPEVGDLEIEARRLLRYRIPLILAVCVNFFLLVRVPTARLAVAHSDASSAGSSAMAGPLVQPSLTRPSQLRAVEQEIAVPGTESAEHASAALLAALVPADLWTTTLPQFEAALRQQQPAVRAYLQRALSWRPPIEPPPAPRGLTLRNALENGGPVRFLVNGRAQELWPGEAHEFAAGVSWDVQFHRGDAFGNQQRTLAPGDDRFVVTDQGWDLEPVAP